MVNYVIFVMKQNNRSQIILISQAIILTANQNINQKIKQQQQQKKQILRYRGILIQQCGCSDWKNLL